MKVKLLTEHHLELFTSAVYVQVHFRLHFIIEANTMNPDQTAPLGAV